LIALYLGGGVVAVAAIYFAGALLAFALGLGLVYRQIARPRWSVTVEGCLRVTKEAVPIGVALVALEILFRIGTTMLALSKPSADVGQYGAAYRLLETSLFVTWSVNAAVLPVLSRLSLQSRPSVGFVFGRALKLVLAISVPMAVGAAVLAEPLITTLYGDEYRPAATALALLAPAIMLFPVSSLSSALLYSQHRQRVVAYAYGAVVVQNIATNLVLIPRFSYNGAAASTALSEVLIAASLLVISRPQRERLQARRLLAGAVLAGAVAGVAMSVASGNLPAALLLGVATYMAVLLGVERFAFPDDFAALRAFLDRAHGRWPRREVLP
jgi:O-antigen/teichoic acid export membrane protein